MKNVIRNHSAQQEALSTLQNAQTAEGSAVQTKTQADYTKDSIALQRQGYNLTEKWNNIRLGVNMAKVGTDLGTSVVSMIVSADQSSATNELNTMATEGERLVDESIASGETYFGTNSETGEIELVMSPKVTEWYNNARQSIEDSTHLTSTKNALLQSLDLTYRNLEVSANKSTVQKYYSNLNANFQTSLSSAKRADTESYVAAGGNRDLWNQSSVIEGISIIYGRNDWSAETKAAQTTDYLLSVISDGDTMIASDYARTQGLQAAYNYIQGLSGYTEAEKQKMYSTASSAVTQATSAATETAEAYMTDALVNGSATPKEVYEALGNEYSNASPAIYNSAIEAARAKQISVATTSYSNQLTTDKSNGLFDLYTTYAAMQAGSWDDLFYNISDVKTEALSSYEKAISEKETTYGRTIDESNKSLFSAYETKHKTNLSLFNEGQINGQTYVANEIAYANSFYAGVQGEESDKSLWNAKVNAMATEAINAIIDNTIPERYQSEVTEAFNTIKLKMGLNLTNSKMTAEAQQAIYDMNLEFTGKIASYLQSYDIEKNGTLSVEDFKKYVTQAAQDYVILRQSKGYTALVEGKYKDEEYMSGKVSDFKNALNLAYNYDTGDVFVKLGTDISTGNARYMFSNETVQQTFEELSAVAKTQVSWLTGYDVGDMTTVCVLDDNGAPILAPQVNVNGECYRFKNGTIQICTDGKTWVETGIKLASSSDDMKKNKNKSQTYLAMQEKKDSENLTDVQKQAQKATDTWVQTYKQPTTNELKDHLRESVDIDTTASRLKQLSDQGTIKIRSGLQNVSDYIDDLVAEVRAENTAEEKRDALDENHSIAQATVGETSQIVHGGKGGSFGDSSESIPVDSSPAVAPTELTEGAEPTEEKEVAETAPTNESKAKSTSEWISERKGQEVSMADIFAYLETVDDIEAAAEEIEQAFNRGEIKTPQKQLPFDKDMAINTIKQQRAKGN